MNQEELIQMTRLMNCLVSGEAKQDLFNRFEDDECIESMNGLTEDIAEIGLDWWNNNSDYLETLIQLFSESIEISANNLDLDADKLLEKFSRSSWSDLIRESFYFFSDLLSGYRNLNEINDFMTYAIKMSLEYSLVADLEDLTPTDWNNFTLVFERWWNDGIPEQLFSKVFRATKLGQALINV
jgi:hypothetical protein